MDGIIFDLKSFRSKQLNGMSQEDFAKQIGISQDKVSRMEADPGQIPVDVIVRISNHFGISLDELIGRPKPDLHALSVRYTWSEAEYIRRTLLDYISGFDAGDEHRGELLEFSLLVDKVIRKPKVAFIGRSDVGKSTMINTLLGTSRMPAHWTPATAIAVFIKHINDRPAYMEDDVWVFQSDERTNESWDDTRLNDEDYCRSLRLSSGTYDLLNSYGTRNGEYFAESKASAAVVFLDSSLLLNCDIVDLPGYGTGDRPEDDLFSLREKSKADVLVYLSIANGFMRSEDISYVKEAIPSLANIQSCGGATVKALENLFIVASQAHVIDNGNLSELSMILDAGCERFEKSLTENFWVGREKPDSLRERFFFYSSNSPALRSAFEQDFCELIEKLPKVIVERAKTVMKDWADLKCSEVQGVIDVYEKLLKERNECEKVLRAYEMNEPNRYASFQIARRKVLDSTLKYSSESRAEIADFYSRQITVDNLVSLMEKREVRKKKDDLQIFCSYVSSILQDDANAILRRKSERLAKDIDEFLAEFKVHTEVSAPSKNIVVTPFNAKRAFASGLTGVATYSALAIWASTCGNLGGYILVAKAVSLLSSLGISVGGTAAATAAVAAISGPVVLGIALAVIAAAAAFAVFSTGWKKNMAKKIVSAFKKEDVLLKLQNSMDAFWGNTKTAFEASADKLDSEWKHHISTLRNQLRKYDAENVKKAKKQAEELRYFLQDIPF